MVPALLWIFFPKLLAKKDVGSSCEKFYEIFVDICSTGVTVLSPPPFLSSIWFSIIVFNSACCPMSLRNWTVLGMWILHTFIHTGVWLQLKKCPQMSQLNLWWLASPNVVGWLCVYRIAWNLLLPSGFSQRAFILHAASLKQTFPLLKNAVKQD